MLVIHTRPLDAKSRTLQLVAGEKRAAFHKIECPQFEITPALLQIDEKGRTPILVDDMWQSGAIIKEVFAAFEYIEDIAPFPSIYPGGPLERAEIRSFVYEAFQNFAPLEHKIMVEKVHKVIYRTAPPDTQILREIRDECAQYIDEIGKTAVISGHMVGAKLSLADFAIAAQISVLDYLDLINWEKHRPAKTFYRTIKQRPAFGAVFNDNIKGINPPPYYHLLDF